MLTSFRVGAIFEISDLATPVVVRLAGEMQKLATLTATVRAELQGISNIRIGSITNRLTAMSAALDRGATAASAMSGSIVSGAAAADASLSAALVTARALTAQLAAAGRAGAGMRIAGAGGGGGPPPLPGAGRGGGRPHGPFHFGRVGAHAVSGARVGRHGWCHRGRRGTLGRLPCDARSRGRFTKRPNCGCSA